MYTKNLLSVGAVVAGALAQTPPDTTPATSNSLDVQYGSVKVTPYEILLASQVSSAPQVSLPTQQQGNFMVFMLDLDILQKQVVMNAANTSALASLTPGYGPGRTTRVHWWQGNLTQGSDGVFTTLPGAPDGPAPYAMPKPPAGDVPHAYTLYLFHQPASYMLPAYAAEGNYDSSSTAMRFNFSLADTVSQCGGPIAANYYGGVASKSNYSVPSNLPGATVPAPSAAGPSSTGSAPGGTGSPIATAGAGRLQAASALVLGAAGALALAM